MLENAAIVELVLCWLAWALAFWGPRMRAGSGKITVRAPASRWGIVVTGLGFALISVHVRPVGFEKSAPSLIASMIFAPFSAALAWAATRHLGKQWRFEAALIEGHELIQTGPYAWVRHPIYTSMVGMGLAAGFALTWWPMFVAGLALILAGTEIRAREEDRLLAGRFGDAFIAYRSRVRAYIPFLR
jgi:protein-S-isoprenylcysteine O-methyltransferase Ste14